MENEPRVAAHFFVKILLVFIYKFASEICWRFIEICLKRF
jgi:hypothetical protein